MIGIYRIRNLINGKCYIGQSVNIERRWYEHKLLNRDDRCRVLKRALRKYGLDNFYFEIIEVCEVGKLNELEIFWIAKINPEYNQTLGGIGAKGHYHSAEIKEVLSKRSRRQWNELSEEDKINRVKNNLKGPKVGHGVSEATREKLRLSNIGKKQSEETKNKRAETRNVNKLNGRKHNMNPNSGNKKKKVFCVELEMEFESMVSAERYIDAYRGCVLAQVSGRRKHAKGYHFIYV